MAVFAFLALLLAAQPAVRPPEPAPAPPPDATPLPPTAWPFRDFSGDDYPAAALRARQEGRVVYRLRIGASGRVTSCDVRVSSGSPALDNATCRIVRSRARFNPAVDSAGRPIPDQRDGDVLWLLGRDGNGRGED